MVVVVYGKDGGKVLMTGWWVSWVDVFVNRVGWAGWFTLWGVGGGSGMVLMG